MKYKIHTILLIGLNFLVISHSTLAQKNEIRLTGNLHTDTKILFNPDVTEKHSIQFSDPMEKKSTFIAAALSVVLPGAGEVYTQSYWKAGIFAVVEATAIVVAVSYNKKGDNQTNYFQNYADAHWSIKRYAEWTLANVKNINPAVDASQYAVINNDGTVNHPELNRLERDLGSGYSHALPVHGEQQYYELIGKYPQYSHGWDDANQSDIDFHILSANFLDYSKMRGKANDYYNVSDKAVLGIYFNHLLSGLDAVWSAISFNKDLAVNVRMNHVVTGYDVVFFPTVNMKYAF